MRRKIRRQCEREKRKLVARLHSAIAPPAGGCPVPDARCGRFCLRHQSPAQPRVLAPIPAQNRAVIRRVSCVSSPLKRLGCRCWCRCPVHIGLLSSQSDEDRQRHTCIMVALGDYGHRCHAHGSLNSHPTAHVGDGMDGDWARPAAARRLRRTSR